MIRPDVAALKYIGTPYHPNGRLINVGIDCGGLLICVGRDIGAFANDFDLVYGESPKGDNLLVAMDSLFDRVESPNFGDIAVIRTSGGVCHTGILSEYCVSGKFSLIHASDRCGAVVVHRLMSLLNFDAVRFYRYKNGL